MENIEKNAVFITGNHARGSVEQNKVFEQAAGEYSFAGYMTSVIEQFRLCGKQRCAESYQSALNSFMQFRNGNPTALNDITADTMQLYETYLHNVRGITKNSSSFYMRILRAVFNRAVEQNLVPHTTPFKYVYTGIDKTTKRAIPLSQVRKIKALQLGHKPALAFARDLFLFSFYTRGMSFVDIAYLKKKDLNNGILTYCRRKTGQRLQIKWEHCMMEIVERYNNPVSPFMFPIIRVSGCNERKQYINTMCTVNARLKRIAQLAGIKEPLTMYVARHSWASIAKSRNIPVSIISEALGHDSEATTQIYLASFENSVIDCANSMILKLLL